MARIVIVENTIMPTLLFHNTSGTQLLLNNVKENIHIAYDLK